MREDKSSTLDANVVLSQKAFLKMKYYTEAADDEISGLGKTKMTKEGNILVEDVIILNQECSAARTELDDDAQAKFLFELQKKNESPKNWNVWWHSHANMAVMWSGTDDDTIADHAGLHTHLISIVTNKKGEYKARVDVFPKDESPLNAKVSGTYNLDVKVLESAILTKERQRLEIDIEKSQDKLDALYENPTIEKQCEKEVEKKVRESKPVMVDLTKKQGDFGGYWDDHCKVSKKDGKWGFFGGMSNILDNVKDEATMEKIINSAEKASQRTFSSIGYDEDGYTIDGHHREGYYNTEFDEIRL